MVDVQTNQAREMREAVGAHEQRMAEIPAQSERNLGQLDQEYQALKQQVQTRHETVECPGRAVAKGDELT